MAGNNTTYSVRIPSTGIYLPEGVVDNAAVVERVRSSTDEADFLTPEWIEERVGIQTRRRFLPHESLVDSNCVALKSALDRAGWQPEDLDFIILASISTSLEDEGMIIPSTACLIQEAVGAVNAFAYDMLAACSGFVYGMAQAVGFIESGFCDRGALLCSESHDNGLDYTDPKSCILIGDVSTATLFERSEAPQVHNIVLDANDARKQSGIIWLPYGGHFGLEGRRVFKTGVKAMVSLTRSVLERSGVAVDDVDWFIFHQANLLMLESVGHLLGIPTEKNLMNVQELGNTTAGTIPSVLAQRIADGTIRRGDRVVFTAFGGGLTGGSILITY